MACEKYLEDLCLSERKTAQRPPRPLCRVHHSPELARASAARKQMGHDSCLLPASCGNHPPFLLDLPPLTVPICAISASLHRPNPFITPSQTPPHTSPSARHTCLRSPHLSSHTSLVGFSLTPQHPSPCSPSSPPRCPFAPSLPPCLRPSRRVPPPPRGGP